MHKETKIEKEILTVFIVIATYAASAGLSMILSDENSLMIGVEDDSTIKGYNLLIEIVDIC